MKTSRFKKNQSTVPLQMERKWLGLRAATARKRVIPRFLCENQILHSKKIKPKGINGPQGSYVLEGGNILGFSGTIPHSREISHGNSEKVWGKYGPPGQLRPGKCRPQPKEKKYIDFRGEYRPPKD